MEPQGCLGVEGDPGLLGLLVPSPRSEAVTHELEELSLQPFQSLPPLKERKNGQSTSTVPNLNPRPMAIETLVSTSSIREQASADTEKTNPLRRFVFGEKWGIRLELHFEANT